MAKTQNPPEEAENVGNETPKDVKAPKKVKYMPSVFPSWCYHPTKAGRIFNTPEELAAAGDGWGDKPYSEDGE